MTYEEYINRPHKFLLYSNYDECHDRALKEAEGKGVTYKTAPLACDNDQWGLLVTDYVLTPSEESQVLSELPITPLVT